MMTNVAPGLLTIAPRHASSLARLLRYILLLLSNIHMRCMMGPIVWTDDIIHEPEIHNSIRLGTSGFADDVSFFRQFSRRE